MPPPKKYIDAIVTTMRLERKSKKIADALGILLSDSLAIGLNCQIRMRINDDDSRVTPEIIQDYKDLELQSIKEIEGYIRLKNAEQTTLEKMIGIKKEAQKDEELIEVWDRGEDAYIRIKKSQFDPTWHTLREGSGGSGL